MTMSLLQVRNRWLLAVLLIAGILLKGTLPAQAKWEAPPKTEIPAQEEPVSLGDLWDSAIDLLPSVAPPDAPAVPNKTTSSPEKEKKPEGVIEAKRLSDTGKVEPKATDKKPAEPPKPEPYKVYPSPYIPDEMPVTRSLTPSMPEPSAPTPAQEGPVVIEGQTAAANAENRNAPPPLTGPVTVPITGMSRQFFPILPLNAPQDATPQFLPLASNHDLAKDMSSITRAIIVIHDITRNASDALTGMTTLTGSENDSTLILAPQFPLDIDITRFLPHLPNQGRGIARWPVARNTGWQTGEESLAKPPERGISSFTVLDLLLLYLSDRNMFPSLQRIIIAGHGMGGDFVQRYAAMGQAPDIVKKQGLSVNFLIANPSSYLYFTSVRPSPTAPNFTLADITQCPGVTGYPYGMANLANYARRSGVDTIRLRYPERRVVYLLSESILSDPYLDNDCAAQAQGKDRLARGRNYERYLTMSFGDKVQHAHTFAMVQNANYDPINLFGSYCGMSVLFGDGKCSVEPYAASRMNPGTFSQH